MAEQEADCLIVGGGIGGAVLALALAQRGRHVLILERETAPLAMPRPEILAGATLEAFGTLGVRDRIMADAALPLEGLELYDAKQGQLFQVTADDLRAANAAPHSTDPARTRHILLDAALQTGRVSLQRGVEVLDLIRQNGVVTGVAARRDGAPVSLYARLTIGDDGTRSKVREAMGSSIALEAFPLDFIGAVIPRPSGQPEGVGQAWVNPWELRSGLFAGLFLPIPGKRTALVFACSPAAADQYRQGDAPRFYMDAATLSPLCGQPGLLPDFPKGFGYFRRPFGHTDRYVADGVALMGDAAHPVTPAGGQGANMSVADAMVLADVAEDSLRSGDIMGERLYRYQFLRWEANARSLFFSERPTQVLNLLMALPMLAPLLEAYIRSVNRADATKRQFIGAVARTFMSTAAALLLVLGVAARPARAEEPAVPGPDATVMGQPIHLDQFVPPDYLLAMPGKTEEERRVLVQDWRLEEAQRRIWQALSEEFCASHDCEPTEEDYAAFAEGIKRVTAGRPAPEEPMIPEVEYLRLRTELELLIQTTTDEKERVAAQEALVKLEEVRNWKQGDVSVDVARAMIKSWKFNRALFAQYGGRVIWQQIGLEPIGAYEIWLKEHEAKGSFVLRNPALIDKFWMYFKIEHSEVDDEFLASAGLTHPFERPWWLTEPQADTQPPMVDSQEEVPADAAPADVAP